MKGLEIVNRKLNKLEMVHKDIDFTAKSVMEKQELETIKADLEILAILRKCYKVKYGFITKEEKIVPYIEVYRTNALESVEEFNKLKQWLEENDNA